MDLGLTDRVYVLTGASRGLGYATAQSLVADGARVVLSARREDAHHRGDGVALPVLPDHPAEDPGQAERNQ
ncbi:SDR family NAD(P)-dependent oxidoreductase, partial [Micromonospora sp. NPDC047753]|uniref:SDR family NAD(P)-dependent oxidoreductase n=1 Tax=Micromonospora sp. NPDC047753 TaxID=3154817 RepID=UPI0033EF3CE0